MADAITPSGAYAANPHRVAWQVDIYSDVRRRMEFCNRLIGRKIEACILTLEKSVRRSHVWEKAMQRAYADLSRIELDPPTSNSPRRRGAAQSAIGEEGGGVGGSRAIRGVDSHQSGLRHRTMKVRLAARSDRP
jgi:hypothetical protein